jgi:hypothetical protein
MMTRAAMIHRLAPAVRRLPTRAAIEARTAILRIQKEARRAARRRRDAAARLRKRSMR